VKGGSKRNHPPAGGEAKPQASLVDWESGEKRSKPPQKRKYVCFMGARRIKERKKMWFEAQGKYQIPVVGERVGGQDGMPSKT